MKNSRTIAAFAFLVSGGAGATGASHVNAQAADRGSYVARIGKDTLAVESFSRTAQQLTGRSVLRGRVLMIRDYKIDLNADGTVRRYEVRSYPLKSYVSTGDGRTYRVADAAADSVPGTLQIFEYAADSITVTQRQGASPQRVSKFANTGYPLPFSENTFAPWAETVRRAQNTSQVALFAGRNQLKYAVKKPAPGRIVLDIGADNDFGPMIANVDAQGRMTQFDMRATTDKYLVDRVAFIDLDPLMASFVSRPLGSLSPRDTARAVVAGANVRIDYSKPSARGRKVFGTGGMQPWGVVWRAGADAATQLITDRDLVVGGTAVPAGTYSIFVVPAENGTWQFVINRQNGQWGTEYDMARDLARIPVHVAATPSFVEQMQFTIVPDQAAAPNGGAISLAWENSRILVPFTVK
jgi:hypothetical protein